MKAFSLIALATGSSSTSLRTCGDYNDMEADRCGDLGLGDCYSYVIHSMLDWEELIYRTTLVKFGQMPYRAACGVMNSHAEGSCTSDHEIMKSVPTKDGSKPLTVCRENEYCYDGKCKPLPKYNPLKPEACASVYGLGTIGTRIPPFCDDDSICSLKFCEGGDCGVCGPKSCGDKLCVGSTICAVAKPHRAEYSEYNWIASKLPQNHPDGVCMEEMRLSYNPDSHICSDPDYPESSPIKACDSMRYCWVNNLGHYALCSYLPNLGEFCVNPNPSEETPKEQMLCWDDLKCSEGCVKLDDGSGMIQCSGTCISEDDHVTNDEHDGLLTTLRKSIGLE